MGQSCSPARSLSGLPLIRFRSYKKHSKVQKSAVSGGGEWRGQRGERCNAGRTRNWTANEPRGVSGSCDQRDLCAAASAVPAAPTEPAALQAASTPSAVRSLSAPVAVAVGPGALREAPRVPAPALCSFANSFAIGSLFFISFTAHFRRCPIPIFWPYSPIHHTIYITCISLSFF